MGARSRACAGRSPVRTCIAVQHDVPQHSTPCAAAMMATVYEDHKDEDGFLYITYSGENTFGDLGLEPCPEV